MSGNLLEMVHRHVDQASIDTMASLLGQSRQTIHDGASQVIPALVGGLAQKASSRQGADELHATLDRVDDGILNDVPNYLRTNTSHVTQSGASILGGIFGAELGNVIGRLSPLTGLGEAGTSSMMKMLAPVTLAVLARHRRQEHLDAVGVASYLDDQRAEVNQTLHPSVAALFSFAAGHTEPSPREEPRPFGGTSALQGEQIGPQPNRLEKQTEAHSNLRWLVPLLGVAAIVALAYGLLRHRELDGVDTIDPAVHGIQDERPGEGPETPPRHVPEQEPGVFPGMEPPSPGAAPRREETPLRPGTGPETTVEGEVGAEGAPGQEPFMQPEDETLYLGTLFGSGSSALETQPANRLNPLLELVQEHPDRIVEVRGYAFGGETDEVMDLGEERAEAVRRWLVGNGVPEERIHAVSGGASARSQIDVFLR